MIYGYKVSLNRAEPVVELFVAQTPRALPDGFQVCSCDELLIWWRQRDRLTLNRLIETAERRMMREANEAEQQQRRQPIRLVAG
jgi:hypothetical protein